MHDVTPLFARFREAARHLWNAWFHTGDPAGLCGDAWDDRDNYSKVVTELFAALVTEPLGAPDQRLPPMWEASPEPLTVFAVQPSDGDAPILINRESPRTGYWDDPVRRIKAGEATLHFVRFFDWGELGIRDFQYIEARIAGFPTRPELEGRYALIEFAHVRIQFIEKPAPL